MSRFEPTFASFVLAVFLAACVAPPHSDAPANDAVVYVIARGWHTDIGLPVQELVGPLATLEANFPGARFLTFGFGERQFLVDHRKSFAAMLHALLPSQSALLMTVLRATPGDAFGQPNVVALHISRSELEQIEANIWQELELSSAGKPILLANGPYPGSVFYGARETYDGFYTCNTWTAKTLRAGGLPMPATGVLFASQVMGMARWIGARSSEVALTSDINRPLKQGVRP